MPNLVAWGIGGAAVALAIGAAVAVYGVRFEPDDVNEGEPPRAATIVVSDPQLYARETLINDRREEFEYLGKLLTESADRSKVTFSPQVIRDISVVSALRAAAQAGSADSDTGSNATNSQPANTSNNSTATPDPTKQAQNVKADSSKLESSPQEAFRDRQAYRGDLRAALASVNLDDLHDLGGNSLFRLQFKVGIFPGEIKNKFGAAQLTIQRPALKREDIQTIYRTWLGHITSRINHFDDDGRLNTRHEYGAWLEPHMKLLKLYVSKKSRGSDEKDPCLMPGSSEACHALSLAVPPNSPSPI